MVHSVHACVYTYIITCAELINHTHACTHTHFTVHTLTPPPHHNHLHTHVVQVARHTLYVFFLISKEALMLRLQGALLYKSAPYNYWKSQLIINHWWVSLHEIVHASSDHFTLVNIRHTHTHTRAHTHMHQSYSSIMQLPALYIYRNTQMNAKLSYITITLCISEAQDKLI